MYKKGVKVVACILAGAIAFSGLDFSTNATSVSEVLPVAGLSLTLEEGTSVDAIQQEIQSGVGNEDQVLVAGASVTDQEITSEPTILLNDTLKLSMEELLSPNMVVAQPLTIIDEQLTATVSPTVVNVENIDEADLAAIAVSENALTDVVSDNSVSENAVAEATAEYAGLIIANVDDYVNIRSIPSTDGDVVGKLYKDSVGTLISEADGWYQIESGNVTGYVKAEYFIIGEEAQAMIDDISTKVATVATTTLKVREEPSLESAVLQLIPMGDNVTVVEELDGWVRVSIDGTDGYVSSEYVTVATQFITAESIAEEEARLEREAEEERRAEEERQAEADRAAAAQASTPAAVVDVPTTVYTTETSVLGVSVSNFALQFVGNPYVYGGTSLTNGADCSGFVLAVYSNFGVSLPHSANADRNQGTAVDGLANAQPGDLVCYPGHVGIYIGNGQIVHASTSRTGIKISDATYNSIVAIRRIF